MLTQSTFPAGLHIRAATGEDARIIYNFICALEETTLNLTEFEPIFQQNLANPFIHYLVAEWHTDVVGFVSCHVQYLLHHCGKVGEIQELFVQPDLRNQRIGHHLVAALNALAVQEGFVNLEVTTNQKRTDTLRFYEQELFKQTHFKLVKSIHP